MRTNSEPGRPARAAILLVLAAGFIPGCGAQQVAPAHREIVLQLATATSTRDPKLLDAASAEVDRLTAAKEMSDGEERAFREILDAARSGEWDQARDLAYTLRDGQEPTDEDRERVAKRTLRDPKPPPGKTKPRRAGGTAASP